MEKGPATFGMLLKKPEYATHLPHSLKFFVVRALPISAGDMSSTDEMSTIQPATSLGGVESLIEQRSLSDPNADPRLSTSSAFVLCLPSDSNRSELTHLAVQSACPSVSRTSRI